MKLAQTFLLITALLCAGASPLLAQAAAAATTLPASESPEPSFLDEEDVSSGDADVPEVGGTLARVAGVMLLLFVVLFAGLVLFQKMARRGMRIGNQKRPLQLVDRLTLGPKTSICLVRTAGKTLVIGVSEKEMTVLMDTSLEEGDGKAFSEEMGSAKISDAVDAPKATA